MQRDPTTTAGPGGLLRELLRIAVYAVALVCFFVFLIASFSPGGTP